MFFPGRADHFMQYINTTHGFTTVDHYLTTWEKQSLAFLFTDIIKHVALHTSYNPSLKCILQRDCTALKVPHVGFTVIKPPARMRSRMQSSVLSPAVVL